MDYNFVLALLIFGLGVDGAIRGNAFAPLGPRTEQTIDGIYLIVLKAEIDLDAHISWFDDLHAATIRSHNPTAALHSSILDTYDYGAGFRGYSAMLHHDMLKALRAQNQVAYIDRDQLVYVDIQTEADAIRTRRQHERTLQDAQGENASPEAAEDIITRSGSYWNLARISHRTNSSPYAYIYPSTAGDDVEIHVLDTGILASHNQFNGRVVQGVNLVTGESNSDFNGHGTHVAGIAGGSAFGVAPKATIVNVKVMDSAGVGNFGTILAGLNWVVARKNANPDTPMIANLSLSGIKSNAVNAAMAAATAAGVHVVVAAGNNGKDACSYSPASAGGDVFSIGSIDSNNQMSYFSNRGNCVDLFAPGGVIQSAGIVANNAIAYKSGTSMAAPHVAGVVALILADVGNVSPGVMKSTVVSTISTKNNVLGMNGCGGNNYMLFNQRIVGTSSRVSTTHDAMRLDFSGDVGDNDQDAARDGLSDPYPVVEQYSARLEI